jgi:DGQHR domain-containing protein
MNNVPVIRLKQNEYDLLVFAMEAHELLKITYIKDRIKNPEIGIQRPLSFKRIDEIADYLSEDEAALPNSIIINFDLALLNLSISDIVENNQLNISKLIDTALSNGVAIDKIAYIIDGQHRLQAFNLFEKKYDLIVTAFIDLTLAEIAEFFVKINYYQTKVNRSQVFDLLGIQPELFPEFNQVHLAINELNKQIDSPFYQNIKMLGIGPGIISQASLISAFTKYKIHDTLIQIFNTADKDTIYTILWYYFKAIQNNYSDAWGKKGNMLSKSIGIRALIQLLREILLKFNERRVDNFDDTFINEYINKIPVDVWSSEDIKGLTGESGVKKIYQKLSQIINQ